MGLLRFKIGFKMKNIPWNITLAVDVATVELSPPPENEKDGNSTTNAVTLH